MCAAHKQQVQSGTYGQVGVHRVLSAHSKLGLAAAAARQGIKLEERTIVASEHDIIRILRRRQVVGEVPGAGQVLGQKSRDHVADAEGIHEQACAGADRGIYP